MPTIKIKQNIGEIDSASIRRKWVERDGKWYFSIVDVISALTDSADARNYWKVLKSRLKSSRNELVTRCNQLKLESKDGKFYLTDTGDFSTIIHILEFIPSARIVVFEEWAKALEAAVFKPEGLAVELEAPSYDARLMIDGYQTESEIVIEAMIAGMDVESLKIFVTPKQVTIKGVRSASGARENKILDGYSNSSNNKNYLHQELLWENFCRAIILPSLVETASVEKSYDRGHLKIKLKKAIN